MTTYDACHYPYPSRRTTVFARRGMVATSHPLAAQAGLDILKKGGNAIDAAVAAAMCLTVVEPTGNGIGGDAFCLVWAKGKLHGLNASGPSPRLISAEAVKEKGYQKMPQHGWLPVTVPGAPAAWAELSQKFGRLPLGEVAEPSVNYAQNGHPLSPGVAHHWHRHFTNFKANLSSEIFQDWFDTFAPGGKAPKAGEIWHSPGHAKTLQSIAETSAQSFYCGELSERIDKFSRETGGYLRQEDLEQYQPEWVEPLKVNYRGYDVWELPPNGQGLVALLALNILKEFQFNSRDHVDSIHRQLEAIKLSFEDGIKHITDPKWMTADVGQLLQEGYAAQRRNLITDEALMPSIAEHVAGGTVYLTTADEDGNMVSYIQSNYLGFGSGLVVPGTGIALHSRGMGFSLDPLHANYLEPGKRTYHTIIPGFLTRRDRPVASFGVMGAFMQPQGHLQAIMNMLDFGLNPQAALDAPRWCWTTANTVELEHAFPRHLAQALEQRGHKVVIPHESTIFGRGQIIWRDEVSGVYAGGSDPRADGLVAGW